MCIRDSDQGDNDETNDVIKFTIELPSRIERGAFSLADLIADLNDMNVVTDVIINGRAFGGVGSGDFDQSATATVAALGASALLPNRVGESRDALVGKTVVIEDNGDRTVTFGTGYMSFLRNDGVTYNELGNLTGPNESYDGPDYQNMYLSGFDSSGNLKASFYCPSLESFHSAGPPPAPGAPTYKFLSLIHI